MTDNYDGTATITWQPVQDAISYDVSYLPDGGYDTVAAPVTTLTTATLPLGTVLTASVSALVETAWLTGDPITLSPPPPPPLKSELVGLLTRTQHKARNDAPPPAASGIEGAAFFVEWRELQPVGPGSLVRPNPLDVFLDRNAAAGYYPKIKLRVECGDNCPDWVEALGGGPVTMLNNDTGRTGSFPKFWTPEFQAAYADLQALLAAAYDDDERILQNVIAGSTTFNGEPYNRQMGARGASRALMDAGYTTELDLAAHTADLAAHQAWKRTQTSIAFNPYQAINTGTVAQWHTGFGNVPPGGYYIDEDVTEAAMEEFVAAFGDRAVLENNSVSGRFAQWDPSKPKGQMYAKMQAMRAANPRLTVSIQTEQAQRLVGSEADSLRYSTDVLGACSIELTNDWATNPAYSPALMAEIKGKLHANARA